MVTILITAGPTREYLDDVRYLTNGSSGRTGCALAQAALERGHAALLVLGPVDVEPPPGAEVRSVTTALEMQAAAEAWFDRCQVAIAAAAVADWRPRHRATGKPARGGPFTLELVPNPDIVSGLAERKGDRVVVGFALEAAGADWDAAVARGRGKLRAKALDLVVCNRADAIGSDGNEVVLLDADGGRTDLPRQDKAAVAAAIVDRAVARWEARRAS